VLVTDAMHRDCAVPDNDTLPDSQSSKLGLPDAPFFANVERRSPSERFVAA
jgi:hypothetical protein